MSDTVSRLYTCTVAGIELLVSVYEDGEASLATRLQGERTWGPQYSMVREEVDSDPLDHNETPPDGGPDAGRVSDHGVRPAQPPKVDPRHRRSHLSAVPTIPPDGRRGGE